MLRQVYLNPGRSQATDVRFFSLVPWRETPSADRPLDWKPFHRGGLPPRPPPSKAISKRRGIWSSFFIQWIGRRSNPELPGTGSALTAAQLISRLNFRCVFIASTDSVFWVYLCFLSLSCYWNAKRVLRTGDLVFEKTLLSMGFPCSNKVVKSNQITVAADRSEGLLAFHLAALRAIAYVIVSVK